MNKKMIAMAAFALAAMSFMSSCKDDDDDDTPQPAGNANVLLVHASPDAPTVDILVDNAVAVDSVSFLDNTPYLPIPAGTRNIKLNAAGTSTTAFNADVTLTKNKNYSVFACDSLSKLSAIVLEDDLTAPATGKAHVRFVHLSPNAPAVDVAVTGGPVVFGDYVFKEASAFTPVDAGTLNLEVRLAGTSTVVLPLPGVTLTAGKIYTVYAKGFVGGFGEQELGAQIIVNN
jgi:hypothetical protein